jgi:prepilin-type N-terminal cleavage/methylation domain-containing protein
MSAAGSGFDGRDREMRCSDDAGFTLVELLIGVFLLLVAAVGFYSVMFSGTRSTDTTQSVVRISEEARLGFNRMVRDTREADSIVHASPAQYRVLIDFDGDGSYDNPNADGDYEDLTFSFNAGEKTITLNGELLIAGVEQIAGEDVFTFTSNLLQYDWSGDGVTSWQELDEAPNHGVSGVGNNNGVLDEGELPFLTNVGFAFRVEDGNRSTEFYAEAQLRNRR